MSVTPMSVSPKRSPCIMQSSRMFFILLIFVASSFSAEYFRSFSSCISIQDIEIVGDTVWVASSGGIYKHSRLTGQGILLPNTSLLPDPLHTSLTFDSEKSVWSGTNQGYLARYGAGGKKNVFYPYVSAKWPITSLQSFGKYVIVGSEKGLSIFDTKKMNAVKNATKFNTFPTTNVNALLIHNNILYVGLDQGVAKLNISGGIESIKNMFDPGIWIMDTSTVTPVRSFLVSSGIVKTFSGFSTVFKGEILHSDKGILYSNNKEIYRFPSDITVLKSNGSECWVGTKENYFYRWDGSDATNYSIPGMTCSNINRILVDHASNVWLIPRINAGKFRWWHAIMSLQNDQWKLYNKQNYPEIDNFGDNPNSIGITESHHPGKGSEEWKLWFGFSGGGIKCFEPGLDKWSVFSELQQIGTGAPSKFFYNNPIWTKNDAVAQDSSGYIWISFWRNSGNNYRHHSLLCYDSEYKPDTEQKDPEKAHFRWFFDVNDSCHADNYTVLHVDKEGNIIAGSEDGKVIIFNHSGNPLKNSVSPLRVFTRGRNEFGELQSLGKVLDMASTIDGATWIVTQNGVYKLEVNLSDPSFSYISDTLYLHEEFGTGVKAIEAEDGSVLWMGITNEGVVRYDLLTNERTVFGTAQGLISTNITDLALDRKNGILWIATEEGISRFSIGYNSSENHSSSVLVYPNPFSKKRHTMIHFKNLPGKSKVDIFDLSGKLIDGAKVARESIEGSYYTWTPSSATIPGTYFYSIHGDNIKKAGKFIITP